MARVYEYENGELKRSGYLGEAECPLCGAPVPAIFYDDGTYEAEICNLCKYGDPEKPKNPENPSEK